MSTRISRRTWLTSLPALGGLLLTGCSRETFVPPRVRGGLTGAADVLTMSTNRMLLLGQPQAREYPRSEIADPFPTWNQTNPRNAEYQRHRSERFSNWRLPISGLVGRPIELSLAEIRSLPARTQVTAHVCEQGWSAIGEWTGTPLQRVLDAAGGVTSAARYVVIDTFDGWYEGYDLFEVEHPQTILAYGLNGRDLRLATARRSACASSGNADTSSSSSCDRFRSWTRWRALAGAPAASTQTSASTGLRASELFQAFMMNRPPSQKLPTRLLSAHR